jgi:hypothetical protein
MRLGLVFAAALMLMGFSALLSDPTRDCFLKVDGNAAWPQGDKQEGPPPARADAVGDPAPAGVLARMGACTRFSQAACGFSVSLVFQADYRGGAAGS